MQSLREAYLGTPAEDTLRPMPVRAHPRGNGGGLVLHLDPMRLGDDPSDGAKVRLHTGAHIERTHVGASQGCGEGVGYVINMDPVFRDVAPTQLEVSLRGLGNLVGDEIASG